jgi:hypothetical protein
LHKSRYLNEETDDELERVNAQLLAKVFTRSQLDKGLEESRKRLAQAEPQNGDLCD